MSPHELPLFFFFFFFHIAFIRSLVPSVRPPPPPLPPPLPPPSPPPHLTSSSLREKARSALVDTYRRYVLTELARRSLPGSYYTWIIKSMLRRISDSLDDLLRDARGSLTPEDPMNHKWAAVDDLTAPMPPSPALSPPSSLDHGSEDTDTDGSSVHTPSATSSFTLNTPSNASVASPPLSSSPSDPEPGSDAEQPTASGEQDLLSADAFATYTALSEHAVRLRQLLVLAGAKAAQDERELRARETILEVRCRRRAWLARRLVASSVGMADLGMSAVFERSPLGLRSWTAEDVEREDDGEEEDEEGPFEWVEEDGRRALHVEMWNERVGRASLRQRLGLSGNQLFPVSEEEEEGDDEGGDEDGALVAREMALDLDFELEVGNDWVRAADEGDEDDEDDDDDDGHPTPLDLVLLERPKARPRMRVRTNSMHLRRRHLESVGGLPLCSPLKGCHRHPGVSEVDAIGFFDHEDSEEFTLSMDLPRRRSGGYDREGWISPALGVMMECR